MREKQVQIINIILHSLVVILGLIAVIMQFFIKQEGNAVSTSGWHIFRFFTNDGNIFCMVVSLINVIYLSYSLIHKKCGIPKWLYLLNLMSAVSGLLIFFTVLFVLFPFYGSILFVGYLMIVLHCLNPILVSISFLFTMHYDCKKYEGAFGMVPMAIYGIPILILIFAKVLKGDLIPYPFLRVYDNPWWITLLMIIGMFGGCALAGILLVSITKKTNIIDVNKKKLMITGITLGAILLAIFILVLVFNLTY